MDQRKVSYASFFADEFQAVAAARGLFAETYEALRSRGHQVDVRFGGGEKEVPQIWKLDGFEVNDGNIFPMLKFGYTTDTSSYIKHQYWLVVEFDPGYTGRNTKVSGQAKLTKITRDPRRTPNRMDPGSTADFVVKYVSMTRKAREADLEKRRLDSERDARVKAREELARKLRARANAGRAYVHGIRDSHGELQVSLCCSTEEEAARALALLDAAFPKG